MADEHYDAIVIGTSQGGRFLALELAKAGQKVALVDRDQTGGDCVNTGCTPTKTMVAGAAPGSLREDRRPSRHTRSNRQPSHLRRGNQTGAVNNTIPNEV